MEATTEHSQETTLEQEAEVRVYPADKDYADSINFGAGSLYREEKAFPNTSGLEPVGRAVLVQPYEPELKTDLIKLPDQVRNSMSMVEQRAVVIAVGESAWHDEPAPRAKPGDHVLIVRYAGFRASEDVTADGQEYRLIKDVEIFCRIQKGATK